MAAMREETSSVVFCEAWVEFMIANAGEWAKQNGGGETERKWNSQSSKHFATAKYAINITLCPSLLILRK